MATIPANTRPLEGDAPRLKAPPGVTDCHMHLYLEGFEAQPGGPPIAELATPEDYARVQRRLGLDRVVITQSNAYQLDNGATIEGLKRIGSDTARAVIAVSPDMAEETLAEYDRLGVRGARIMQLPGGALGISAIPAVEARIRDFDWHLMVQFDGREIDEHRPALEAIKTRYVIDHIGKFLEPVAADDPRVDTLLRLIDRGNAWFKIAGAYETSWTGAPEFADVAAIAKRVIAHAPERIVWGSNWPHVGVPRTAYPDDAVLLDNLLDWADATQRQRILVDNPAELYGF
ncbi:amidohydrolase family protein [Pararhizobium mangrovi]|uniref:Amidohydrolase n=1 Tax=Pararhizobium mangrovi TaxID=2590452 RepID=A0A506U9V4_9HYPH|nr:amidohydrolase family protein [Pararhizobium mangrovi]TPW29881.1 amidohydrolase [Pararhizobium mangrovi]